MREVTAIKDGNKLREIVAGLSDYQTEHERRIYLLFMVGICTGLRIGDLIGLRVYQVNHGDTLRLREEKTGKTQEIKIGKELRAVLDAELEGMQDNAFLFPSRQHDKRGRVKHITTATAGNDMHLIAKWFNINAPFSCHSMRKTFGYWHYQENKNLEMLRKQFNHSDIGVTTRYIGLDDAEAKKAVERLYSNVFQVSRKTPAKKRSNQVNGIISTKHHDRTAQKKAFAERLKEGRKRKQIEQGQDGPGGGKR